MRIAGVARHARRAAAVSLLALGCAVSASAQARRVVDPPAAPRRPFDRVAIQVNGGYQPTVTDFKSSATFPLHQEDARYEAGYDVKAGPVVDVTTLVRVYRRLGAGVAVTRFSQTGAAHVTAQLPHPFGFSRLRDISGDTPGYAREEVAVHGQIAYLMPLTRAIGVTLFGGPSWVQAKQDLVRIVDFNESYPYDDATFTGTQKSRDTGSGVGFNVGLDVGYFFSRYLGVGGTVRFSRATVTLATGESPARVDVGGLDVGAGVRFAF